MRRLPALRDPRRSRGPTTAQTASAPPTWSIPAPEATRSGGSSIGGAGGTSPPPAGAAEAEARAQCYAEGVREGRALVQHQLDDVARIMEVFGLLGDFRLGLRVSKKTAKRMVERAKARRESNDGD